MSYNSGRRPRLFAVAIVVTKNDKALEDACVKRLSKGRELMNQAVQELKDVYGGE